MRLKPRVLAVAALLVLTACGSGGEDAARGTAVGSADPAALAAARGEPALTWYSSQDPARNTAVADGFKEAYGLTVTPLRLASGALATRYAQERNSGINNAGVITLAAPALIAEGQSKKWFTPLTEAEIPELAALPDEFFRDGAATTGISVFGIAYNTNLVASPPQDWPDVVSTPDGQIIFGDPRNVPAYAALAKLWMDEYGPEFLTALKDEELQVVDSLIPGLQQLAAGEGQLGLPGTATPIQPLLDAGAPLGFVIPKITTGNEFQTVVADGASSPATAKLFYQYLHTAQGQEAFNGSTSSSAFPDVPGTQALPNGYRPPQLEDIAKYESQIFSLLGLGG